MRPLALAAALCSGVLFTGQASAGDPAGLAGAVDMQFAQNELRYVAGAPTIPSAAGLIAAAQAHATYSAINGTGGHYETAGLPGYTGDAPRDRALAAGFSATFVSEVATGSRDPISGVRSLWDAPYHRLGMIHPNAYAVGWGRAQAASGTYQVVGDIAYDFGMPTVDVVRSPARGQTGIPTSWSGRESPSPVPTGASGPYGYPIMAVWSGGRTVDLRGASLTANGSAIPFYVAPQHFERDYIAVVPQRPLPVGTIAVRFDVTVAGRWLTEEWSFATAGASAPTPAPLAPTTFHSQWVSQSAWPAIALGESATLSVTFRNTGATAWAKGTASEARIGVVGDDRTFFSLGMAEGWPIADRPASQDAEVVPSGATTSFTFRVRGTRAGAFTLRLRPVIDGVAWMEDEGVYLVVAVR